MKKHMIILFSLVLLSIFFAISCNSPVAFDSVDNAVGEEEVVAERVEDHEDNGELDALIEKASRGSGELISATNFTSREVGSGPARGQHWSIVRGGGKLYMRAEDEDGNATPHVNISTDYEKYSPKVGYRRYFQANRTYYVWVLGRGKSGKEDSVHVGISKNPPDVVFSYNDYMTHSSWDNDVWTWSGTRNNGYRARFKVSRSGYYNLYVWMRENGFRYDYLYVTSDSNDKPY